MPKSYTSVPCFVVNISRKIHPFSYICQSAVPEIVKQILSHQLTYSSGFPFSRYFSAPCPYFRGQICLHCHCQCPSKMIYCTQKGEMVMIPNVIPSPKKYEISQKICLIRCSILRRKRTSCPAASCFPGCTRPFTVLFPSGNRAASICSGILPWLPAATN